MPFLHFEMIMAFLLYSVNIIVISESISYIIERNLIWSGHIILFMHVCVCARALSHSVVSNSAMPSTVAHQVLLSMEFSRQEYWSELPFPPPGDPSHPRIEPPHPLLCFLHWQVDSLPLSHLGSPQRLK